MNRVRQDIVHAQRDGEGTPSRAIVVIHVPNIMWWCWCLIITFQFSCIVAQLNAMG